MKTSNSDTASKCLLCNSSEYKVRPGHARDDENLVPWECCDCGLVRLSSFAHMVDNFYEDSHMHDSTPYNPEVMEKVANEDDVRRFHDFYPIFKGKSLLDFGCGSGQFLALAKTTAQQVCGVEPDRSWLDIHKQMGLKVAPTLSGLDTKNNIDVITMFHVLEHIADPFEALRGIKNYLAPKTGRLIIEVPSSDDILLTLYENQAFSSFTYWSCHLYLYNRSTLSTLLQKAGFRVVDIYHYQRYPLANHLYWLAKGKPGGQERWTELNNHTLTAAYTEVLQRMGKTDTIIGVFQVN